MLNAAVHAYLRSVAGPSAHRAGPFVIRFDAHDDALPFNYAVPDDDAAPTAAEIAALVEAFRSRARTPRLEYVPQAAPKLEAALLEAGFTQEADTRCWCARRTRWWTFPCPATSGSRS